MPFPPTYGAPAARAMARSTGGPTPDGACTVMTAVTAIHTLAPNASRTAPVLVSCRCVNQTSGGDLRKIVTPMRVAPVRRGSFGC
jgi:hypothetical protein